MKSYGRRKSQYASRRLRSEQLEARDLLAADYGVLLDLDGETVGFAAEIGDEQAGDQEFDLYKLVPTATSNIALQTSQVGGASEMDTYLRLFDAEGHELARDDDSGAGYFSQLTFLAVAGETYYLGVSGYGNSQYQPFDPFSGTSGSTGVYQLQLNVEAVDSASEARTLAVGESVSSTLTIGGVDRFSLAVQQGTVYSIATSLGTLRDSVLTLYDDSGTELAYNDDASGLASQIQWTAEQSGNLMVEVGSYRGAYSGSYQIEVTTSIVSSAALLSPGETVESSLAQPGAVEQYRVPIEEGATYRFETRLDSLQDSVLRLLDEQGNELAYNDDSDGLASQITWTSDRGGHVILEVGSYRGAYAGSYQVHVATVAELDPPTLVPGEALAGDLAEVGESDVYLVTVEAGVQYRFETELVSLPDSVLTLFDEQGNELAFNDDSDGLASRITWTAVRAGTVRVEVGAYGDSYSGSYRLRVDELGSVVAYDLLAGETVQGDLQQAGETNRYRVAVSAGASYVWETSLGSLRDSVMTLYGEDGNELAYNDDSRGLASRIEWTADRTGEVLLEVGSFRGAYSGSYELSFNDLSIHEPGMQPNLDSSGVLTVYGTTGDDRVAFVLDGDELVVAHQVEGQADGQTHPLRRYPLDSVVSLAFHGYAGADSVANRTSLNLIAWGGEGDDILIGGEGADTLLGGEGNDLLYGMSGADRLLGEAGADLLLGMAGDDRLQGGSGEDVLAGGPGADQLQGEADGDLIVQSAVDDILADLGDDDLILPESQVNSLLEPGDEGRLGLIMEDIYQALAAEHEVQTATLAGQWESVRDALANVADQRQAALTALTDQAQAERQAAEQDFADRQRQLNESYQRGLTDARSTYNANVSAWDSWLDTAQDDAYQWYSDLYDEWDRWSDNAIDDWYDWYDANYDAWDDWLENAIAQRYDDAANWLDSNGSSPGGILGRILGGFSLVGVDWGALPNWSTLPGWAQRDINGYIDQFNEAVDGFYARYQRERNAIIDQFNNATDGFYRQYETARDNLQRQYNNAMSSLRTQWDQAVAQWNDWLEDSVAEALRQRDATLGEWNEQLRSGTRQLDSDSLSQITDLLQSVSIDGNASFRDWLEIETDVLHGIDWGQFDEWIAVDVDGRFTQWQSSLSWDPWTDLVKRPLIDPLMQQINRIRDWIQNPETLNNRTVSEAGYHIAFDFSGLTDEQRAIVQQAADRWESIVVGDVHGVDDLRVRVSIMDDAEFSQDHGSKSAYGGYDPILSGEIPSRGYIIFRRGFIESATADELGFTAVRELGHAMGLVFDTTETLIQSDPETGQRYFTGANAVREYQTLFGQQADPQGVPLYQDEGHWDPQVFGEGEILTPNLISPNAISRITIGALQDLGYQVNYDQADVFTPAPVAFESFQFALNFSGFTPEQQVVLQQAASRWESIITGTSGVSSFAVQLSILDDAQFNARYDEDSEAWGGYTAPSDDALPQNGSLVFRQSYLARASNEQLRELAMHELGHTLGLVFPAGSRLTTQDPVTGQNLFVGGNAIREYRALLGQQANVRGVPLTSDGHWDPATFGQNEVMVPTIGSPIAISRVTLGALQDLGYQVDYAQADPYTLRTVT